MIAFRSLRVVSFSIEYQDVWWEIEPTTDDLQDYDFYVERSESMGGPWAQIAHLIDQYYVRDNDVALHSVNRTFFYRVRAVHRRTDREVISDLASRQGALALDAAEIVRLENLLFREKIGVKCWLFPVRTFGQRCPQCYDRALGKVTDDSCGTCWGVGFSGGWHYPISMWAQVDPPAKSEQSTTSTHLQTQYSLIRMGPAPQVKPLDLIVDNQNRRWKVTSWKATTRFGVPVHQELDVVRVTRGSLEDLVPLRVDNETVALVPAREFTNPTSTEVESADLSAMLNSFGYR